MIQAINQRAGAFEKKLFNSVNAFNRERMAYSE